MKIFLGALLILFAVIIGFIDLGGLVLYLIVMSYGATVMYLTDRNKFFKELYWQLSHPRRGISGNRDAFGHMLAPLMFGAILYAGLTIQNNQDKTDFNRLDFVLLWTVLVVFYFLVVFLPAIIRTRRNIR
jgi:hypothetical protein